MLNQVTIMGRLAAHPELRQTVSGVSVTSFTIACDRDYTPKEKEKTADFINVVAWRSTAEFICKYFGKGRMIVLAGSLQTRNYEDKNGNRRTAVEVVARNAYFADSKKEIQESPSEPSQNDFSEVDDGQDWPF